jgi:Protein of unknown function (DUF2914)/Tetratricopeptide repeat
MPESMDLDATIAAAGQAANAGDYSSAERHLRDALRMQETARGRDHPDLANTLNNLGVIYERTARPDEAEQSYRRAYHIARAAFPPDHPFVATSAANLREFCTSQGRPFERPEPVGDPMAPVGPPARPPVIGPVSQPAPPPMPVAQEARRSQRGWLLAVAAAAALIVVWQIARRTPGSIDRPATALAPGVRDVPAIAPPPAQDAAPEPSASASSRTPEPTSEPTSTAAPPAAAAPVEVPRPATPAPTPASAVTVVEARLCRRLSTDNSAGWQCDAVDGTVPPGPLVFYTRVRTPRATTIEHRWYRGEILHQSVELQVAANVGAGYRTYSRNTVTADRAGDWRVELRDANGVLLDEARVTVR